MDVMTNLEASPLEVTPVAAHRRTAARRDRDVVLPLLPVAGAPVAGGPLPLVLLGLVL
jgi:hypothetical protein